MAEFHFIRPFWFLMLLPLVVLVWRLFRQAPMATAWSKICDSHLLPHLIQTTAYTRHNFPLALLFASACLLIVSLAGPTWSRLPVPTYQKIQPRVVVLDMSDSMLMNDLPPDKLSRAKFKLHDLLQHKDIGQVGLIVYSGEPFIASPLTDDGQTIDALLSSLTPDLMPVEGQKLDSAIEEARKLMTQGGFHHGQILVLTASAPSADAITMAKTVADAGIDTSIMPVMRDDTSLSPQFQQFANAGRGQLISFSDTSMDLEKWLAATRSTKEYAANMQDEIPQWRDQGRWFLIPAILLLLPVFRRGWLQRMST